MTPQSMMPMGKDECDVQFIVNTLLVKTRLGKTEAKTVDGEEIVFTKEYSSGQIDGWDGVSLSPGYVYTRGFSPNLQWGWSAYYGSGWSPELSVIPTAVPYTDAHLAIGRINMRLLRSWNERSRCGRLPDAAGSGMGGPGL